MPGYADPGFDTLALHAGASPAHHFTSVHKLPVDVAFDTQALSPHSIQFNNITYIPETKAYLRFFKRFYAKHLTYSMCYTAGTTGSVTVGPDFLHCHIIFALRPTPEGKAEGLTILVTPKKKPHLPWLSTFNPAILWVTKQVGNYFAKGDTQIFETIRFRFQHPIKEDEAIIKFIQHLEKQVVSPWGFGTYSSPTPLPEEDLNNLLKRNQHRSVSG